MKLKLRFSFLMLTITLMSGLMSGFFSQADLLLPPGGQGSHPPYQGYSNYSSYYSPYYSPSMAYCPQCMAAMAAQQNATLQPWWINSSSNNYWNPTGLGPYNGWGVMPSYYPPAPAFNNPGGGVMMYKPLVYVTAPDHTKIKISPTIVPPGMLMAAVPKLNLNADAKTKDSWSSEVMKNKFVTTEGEYEFFFYDARLQEESFQDQAGACGDREDVLQYMETGLKLRGFPDTAVLDFKAAWSIQLPYHQDLCVYPQSEMDLKSGMHLEVEPKNARVVQLEYVVVPELYQREVKVKKTQKFSKAPTVAFVYQQVDRKLAASNPITVYDWGVGFMLVDRPLPK